MSRKNNNVRRRNIKGRMDRRQKGEPRFNARKEQPRLRPEEIIIPDGLCYFPNRRKGKMIFMTKDKAAKALLQAQQQRARIGSSHVEKRYYSCPEGGCGGFHLTAREEFDENAWKSRGPA